MTGDNRYGAGGKVGTITTPELFGSRSPSMNIVLCPFVPVTYSHPGLAHRRQTIDVHDIAGIRVFGWVRGSRCRNGVGDTESRNRRLAIQWQCCM